MAINIFGVVGEGVRAADIIPQIQAENGEVLEVNIMSVGGDVREGMAIYDALREASANGQEVRTFAIGITASISSIIFMAGDVREVSDNAGIMIHNESTDLHGNKHELKGAIEFLDSVDDKLINVYTDRTDLSTEEVTSLLDQETFMSADEAVSKGFATAKTNALALVAMINKQKEPVNMAEDKEKEALTMFNKMKNLLFGEVKAQDDSEKEPVEEAKAEDDKPDHEAENIALKAELEAIKAKAEDEEEKKKEMDAKAEEEKAKAEDDDDKEKEEAKAESESKAHAIFDAMTSDKITKFEAKNLLTESLEFVNKTLDSRIVNHTGGAKLESPKSEPTEDVKAIWKSLKSEGKHTEAQAYYKENRDIISKKEK